MQTFWDQLVLVTAYVISGTRFAWNSTSSAVAVVYSAPEVLLSTAGSCMTRCTDCRRSPTTCLSCTTRWRHRVECRCCCRWTRTPGIVCRSVSVGEGRGPHRTLFGWRAPVVGSGWSRAGIGDSMQFKTYTKWELLGNESIYDYENYDYENKNKMPRSTSPFCGALIGVDLSFSNLPNHKKRSVAESIFAHTALHFECRFNKNSLLQAF